MSKYNLSEIVRKYKSNDEIFHDLMHFRIREILLVATVYDAFVLEKEDELSKKIFGEYYSLNLTSAPRITSATSGSEALELLSGSRFDMVVLTMRIGETSAFELSEKIKSVNHEIPVLLLLYDNNDIVLLKDRRDKLTYIDRVFVWNRDAKIFLAMIKYIEDKKNVVNDTTVGLVRVILLVENSIRYYSRYLPTLYTEIIQQTQRLIREEHLDDMKKILRMTARPKVLMAVNYEEALDIIEKYKDFLLCVISDVRFPRGGEIDEKAGVKLIEYVRKRYEDLPTLLQSSDQENESMASRLRASFINKNSESLSSDLKDFIFRNLGFGDFIFRDSSGKEIARAASMRQFKKVLKKIPDESLLYHANRNHFSAWLMARGEITMANNIQPVKVTDFESEKEIREYLLKVFEKIDYQNIRGKVIDFDESVLEEENLIFRLADGSLGGKGRGIAFINTIIQNINLSETGSDFIVKIPRTAVIGTEEYVRFIEENKLLETALKLDDQEGLKKLFLKSSLSKELIKKLKVYIKDFRSPLAVRSSGLFEDSLTESFSGVYQTYLVPNNQPDDDERLKQLQNAIKLVYASVFSRLARSYFEAINYKVEEEKMAVVIQEAAGQLYGDRFYPHFSGVAESYNYYPISHMKPSEGIVIMGVGLGKYVIDGENAYRFCPKYPKMEINPPEEQIKNTQKHFYAVNMGKAEVDLIEGEESTLSSLDIPVAEKDGILDHIASVWDHQGKHFRVGLSNYGPRVINFAGVLKYNSFNLAGILEEILDVVKDAMGTPVEIEFAVNLPGVNDEAGAKAEFYILQIKPLVRDPLSLTGGVNVSEINMKDLFIYSGRAMGNGRIDDVSDIIYVDPEKFDRSKTNEMTLELESLNDKLKHSGKHYILIGPGRWGTRDRWLGIPVTWMQISGSRVIIETGLKDFQVDASLGSHFFHNITSMNIGYFTVPYKSEKDFIDWDWLKNQAKVKSAEQTGYFTHLSFEKPLKILMDGKKGVSVVYKTS